MECIFFASYDNAVIFWKRCSVILHSKLNTFIIFMREKLFIGCVSAPTRISRACGDVVSGKVIQTVTERY